MKFILLLSIVLSGLLLSCLADTAYKTTDNYPSSPYRIYTYSTFNADGIKQNQDNPTWDYCGPTNGVTCKQRPAVNGVYPPYTTSNIFWGEAASTYGVSGMGFNGITNTSGSCVPSGCNGKGIVPGGGVPIDIGQLIHYNYPIYAGTYVDFFQLKVYVKIVIQTDPPSTQGPFPFTFYFYVNETTNQYKYSSCTSVLNGCCYYVLSDAAQPCADKIQLVSGPHVPTANDIAGVGIDSTQSHNFVISGVNYTFAVVGFKDSIDVKGNSKYYFISDEKGATVSYLFASLVPACPDKSTCSNNQDLVLNTGDLDANPPIPPTCTCNCANGTDVKNGYCAKTGLTASGNCSCVCDSGYCQNNGTGTVTGTGANQQCACNCAKSTCKVSQVVDTTNRCNCKCDTSYCSQAAYQQSDCSCQCPSGLCQSPYVADAKCNCQCSLTKANCTGTKNIFDAASCSCLCQNSSSCTPKSDNWAIDPSTCGCVCPSSMSATCAKNNRNYDSASCNCSTCIGNFTGDSCANCPLNETYCKNTFGYSFNSTTCSCQSCTTHATCNIDDGLVYENNNYCKCRNCTVGECKCGNKKIEAGETCDDGAETACCKNCQLVTTTCQTNLCMQPGSCKFATNSTVTTCIQNTDKCVSSDCQTQTCNSATGNCTVVNKNHTQCGSDTNLCRQWCVNGACVNRINTNTQPDCGASPVCKSTACDSTTGTCVTTDQTDGSTCDDGDKCTGSTANPDQCVSGKCVGGEKNGPCAGIASLGACYNLTCDAYNGRCNRVVLENHACDDQNPCTVNDKCNANGLCHGTLLSCPTPTTKKPDYPAISDLQDWNNFCVVLGSNSTVCKSSAATTMLSYTLTDLCDNHVNDFCDSGDSSYSSLCPFVKQACKVRTYLDSTDPACRFRKCDTDPKSSSKGLCISASNLLSGTTCDDGNNCTSGDSCSANGTCSAGQLLLCGTPVGGGGSSNTPIIATSVAAGAAVAAAGIAALVVKKMMDSSGLADPFTWGDLHPSTSAQNPLYEPAVSAHDNPLFAAGSS